MATDTRPVRAGEDLDWDKLAVYLREAFAHAVGPEFDGGATLEVEQFGGGHSNLTYLLKFGAQEFVLRRPPFGPVAAKAHDMAREYRILAAVHPVFALAPRPFVLCEDANIIGSVFYVMERRRGEVVRQREPASLAGNPSARRRASAALVDGLADLHAVAVSAPELAALGRPVGFVARQVHGWAQRWHAAQTETVTSMEVVAAWLAANLPPEPMTPTLVHGDYKLDNVMLAADDVGRLTGVFDWEMSALGDPLIDVGILLCYWIHLAAASGTASLLTVTQHEGWYTRDEILEHYAARTGRDLSHIAFYEVFAIFKLAVVLQQIYARYRRGQTDDPRFAAFAAHVAWLAQRAAQVMNDE